jgi:hypothetical protein
MKQKTRTYRQLRRLPTFIERFEYLSLQGQVGIDTFGFDRWMNQEFYQSYEWKIVRQRIIARDLGCDLGVPGHEIHERLLIHHINPLTPDDLRNGADLALDEDNLITTCHRTHNAIHYGDESLLPRPVIQRMPGDTKLW